MARQDENSRFVRQGTSPIHLKQLCGGVDRSNGYRDDAVLMAAESWRMLIRQLQSPGQLAGALYGASDIPNNWAACVAWESQIKIKAANLVGKAAAEDRSHASSP